MMMTFFGTPQWLATFRSDGQKRATPLFSVNSLAGSAIQQRPATFLIVSRHLQTFPARLRS
jgi:hypothetical protein